MKQCDKCGKLTKNKKFCSIECANNVKKQLVKCINCGKETINNHVRTKKYCSLTCQNIYQRHLKYKQMEEIGIVPINPNGEANRKFIKLYLIEKYGDKCSICGITDWNGKPLVKIVDHIDGNSENNYISNFRLVCSNCDSQLDTYKNKNKNCNRKWRKKYYNAEVA